MVREPPAPRGVFAGLATLDVVHRVPRLPGPDEKMTADASELVAGGPAANAAKTFAALGGTAILLTALGGSPAGVLVREDLVASGVTVVDLAGHSAPPPPVASVLVSGASGERAVVGGGRASAEPTVPEFVPQHLADADCLLLDGHHPALALAAARAARERGIEVVVDAGRPKPVWSELLPLAQTVICSADFRLTGVPAGHATASALLGLGVRRVAITAGAGPIRWWSTRPRWSSRSLCDRAETPLEGEITPPAVVAVDTLGAGDVLHGAHCFHAARGLEFPAALSAASALASGRCAHPGLGAWLASIRA